MSDLEGRAFIRRDGALVPSDLAAAEFLQEIKNGREVIVTVRKARNPKHLRKVFALLQLVLDNTEGKWSGTEDLLSDLKMATRLVDVRVDLITGREYIVPRSISFASMDQLSFQRWYKRALFVLSQVLEVMPDELAREVEEAMQ